MINNVAALLFGSSIQLLLLSQRGRGKDSNEQPGLTIIGPDIGSPAHVVAAPFFLVRKPSIWFAPIVVAQERTD